MIRGEFKRADGLRIPNNVTQFGIETLLDLALRHQVATFHVGLCNAVYNPTLNIADIDEPTIGVNGYARKAVTQDIVGWPVDGLINGEVFYETAFLIWAAAGGDYDLAVTRMFICLHDTSLVVPVFALSAPMPEELLIQPATPEANRKFKYQLYGR